MTLDRKYTKEVAQELQVEFGPGVEAELETILINEIINEYGNKMGTIDLFSAIEANLENENLPSSRIISYRLPRQVGTTTFLRDLANRKSNVLFVAKRKEMIPQGLSTFVDSITVDNVALGGLIGFRYDLIVGDCIASSPNFDRALANMHHQCRGHILLIDSVE